MVALHSQMVSLLRTPLQLFAPSVPPPPPLMKKSGYVTAYCAMSQDWIHPGINLNPGVNPGLNPGIAAGWSKFSGTLGEQ